MATDEGKNENNQIKDKVRKFHTAVVASIDPCPRIANRLFEVEVITVQQLRDIKRPDIHETPVEKLLYILYETHHPLAFVHFRDALRLSGEYTWILESIDVKPTGNTTVEGLFHYLVVYETIQVILNIYY